MHEALLAAARSWVQSASSRPARDALGIVELRRATSNAYYALFHAMCGQAADLIAGPGSAHWARVYRSADHARCKSECKRIRQPTSGHPPGIRAFADAFTSLQLERHRADYDPGWTTSPGDVETLIATAESAIERMTGEPDGERRAFVLRLLFAERP